MPESLREGPPEVAHRCALKWASLISQVQAVRPWATPTLALMVSWWGEERWHHAEFSLS